MSTFSVPNESVPSRKDLTVPESEWTWEELRDYVCSEIETRFGPFPRDGAKESGIFKRFMKQYGTDAPWIAKAAFEVYQGMWRGSPIQVSRFTKNSDPYFSTPILAALKGEN